MRTCAALILAAVAIGCGESETNGPPTVTVRPGQSIQAAVDAAAPSTVILVEPGVYHESPAASRAVTITTEGIQIVGLSTPGKPVVLENVAGQKAGIWVSPADSVATYDNTEQAEHPPCGENGNLLHGFQLQGITVRGFDQFGVYLACVDGFTLTQNLADGNQVYGLFPVRSHNGTMSRNETQGTPLDAALYVGQSDHVTITGNSTHDNVLGLEVENSSDIIVTDNQVFDNTAGIVADVMPGLQKKEQTNVELSGNDVHDNNRPNSAQEGQSASLTPPGTGMVILGGSMVTAEHNTVSNNGFAGIIVAGFCSGTSVEGGQCMNLDIDPNPENNRIVNNQLNANGKSPPSNPLLRQLAADLIWDESGSGNCWSGNTDSATVKIIGTTPKLPMCP